TNEFRTIAAPWFRAREVAAVVDLCQAIRVPSARVVDGDQLLDHPQLVARGAFERSSDGGYTFPRASWRFAVSDPAPAPSASGAPWGGGRAGLPYHGLKVVDLGTYWA